MERPNDLKFPNTCQRRYLFIIFTGGLLELGMLLTCVRGSKWHDLQSEWSVREGRRDAPRSVISTCVAVLLSSETAPANLLDRHVD